MEKCLKKMSLDIEFDKKGKNNCLLVHLNISWSLYGTSQTSQTFSMCLFHYIVIWVTSHS